MMLLYLANAINASGNDDTAFFRSAYIWKFGKDITVQTDVQAYRARGAVPQYVEEYVRHIQQRGGDHYLATPA